MLIANQEERRHIHADFGRTIEVVAVECVQCSGRRKVRCGHRLADAEIARKHFPRWKIRGVKRATKTLCPRCAKL